MKSLLNILKLSSLLDANGTEFIPGCTVWCGVDKQHYVVSGVFTKENKISIRDYGNYKYDSISFVVS